MVIASVVHPIGVTKIKTIFSDIFKSTESKATQMIAHHSINFKSDLIILQRNSFLING